MRKKNGFTLIEIAIVLVIIGLLLGGVLKAQELISGARVRNLISQIEGIKLTYLGFQDRFRVLPGDMSTAAANAAIQGNPGGCTGGLACGNGQIGADEIFVVWAQLSKSGFLTGSYTGLITDTAPSASNNPVNPWGGFLQLINDSVYDDVNEPAQPVALNIKSGGMVPPTVLAEIDRKIDDGFPLTGYFRSTGHVIRTTTIAGGKTVAACNTATFPIYWDGGSELRNCAGIALQ